jgi:hypothetical protein
VKNNVSVKKDKNDFKTQKGNLFDTDQRVYRLSKNAVQTKNISNINDIVNIIFLFSFFTCNSGINSTLVFKSI